MGLTMSKPYDTIIIGAGIAGATTAYMLTQKGQNVLVLDKKGIASGGSGAAGAFVSPKIGKGSALQKLTNEAFCFAKDFYLSICPEYFHQTGVIRIPKDEADAQKFAEYADYNTNIYEKYSSSKLKTLAIDTGFDSFFFPEAGDCDAKEVCQFLLKDIEVMILDVTEVVHESDYWHILGRGVLSPTHKAKNIVLATGYQSDLLDLRYMGIRGTWGTRGDFSSGLDLGVSMHQAMSVGANIKGIIKLGATHEKEVKDILPCKEEQALFLKEKASALIDVSDLEIKGKFLWDEGRFKRLLSFGREGDRYTTDVREVS
ncbi:MAG: FAD-dependent oxidoreductase [Sulfurovum sp.]|nr:FAD-dependent oxidoreductase [Sulfurovum sp.]